MPSSPSLSYKEPPHSFFNKKRNSNLHDNLFPSLTHFVLDINNQRPVTTLLPDINNQLVLEVKFRKLGSYGRSLFSWSNAYADILPMNKYL